MPQLTVSLKDRALSKHPLGKSARIGRDPSMDVVIDNVGVSRHHATLRCEGDQYVLSDAGSQNGVYVNGERITERAINDGDVIQVGKFRLDFTSAGAPLPDQPANDTAQAAPSRDVFKTFALDPEQVRQLMASVANQAPASSIEEPTHPEAVIRAPESTNARIWLWVGAATLTAVLVGVAVSW